MTVRIHEQKKIKKSAIELFSRYTDIKILKSELESLGF